jgi:hypothetical protein
MSYVILFREQPGKASRNAEPFNLISARSWPPAVFLCHGGREGPRTYNEIRVARVQNQRFSVSVPTGRTWQWVGLEGSNNTANCRPREAAAATPLSGVVECGNE